jgi:hypothetical protein
MEPDGTASPAIGKWHKSPINGRRSERILANGSGLDTKTLYPSPSRSTVVDYFGFYDLRSNQKEGSFSTAAPGTHNACNGIVRYVLRGPCYMDSRL